MSPSVHVPARCCGPSDSGNGGWTAGAVAHHSQQRPLAVRLLSPPPLDVDLAVRTSGDGRVEVRDGEQAVADAEPGTFEAAPPEPIDPDVAERASQRYIGFIGHTFPRCLSCGPAREPGDGLCIFPGAVDPDELDLVAAPFDATVLPEGDLDPDGALLEPMVWAALDCATAWPSIAMASRPMVLGRMVAEVLAPVPQGHLVVVGAGVRHDGRKHLGASALYDRVGTLLARAEGLWIELR